MFRRRRTGSRAGFGPANRASALNLLTCKHTISAGSCVPAGERATKSLTSSDVPSKQIRLRLMVTGLPVQPLLVPFIPIGHGHWLLNVPEGQNRGCPGSGMVFGF